MEKLSDSGRLVRVRVLDKHKRQSGQALASCSELPQRIPPPICPDSVPEADPRSTRLRAGHRKSSRGRWYAGEQLRSWSSCAGRASSSSLCSHPPPRIGKSAVGGERRYEILNGVIRSAAYICGIYRRSLGSSLAANKRLVCDVECPPSG